MAISAYLEASEVLKTAGTREFAIKTLNRILHEAWSEEDGLAHVVSYSEGAGGPRISGVLDDYALLVHASLDAWERTLELRYYEAAERLAARMQRDFYDATGGGFFDTATVANAIGALTTRRKPLQDTPTPAGNPSAAAALLRLEALSGDAKLREVAEDTLEAFGGIVEHFGLYAGSYGLALERLLRPPQQVVVVGDDDLADALEAAAREGYIVNKTVLRTTAAVLRERRLPPVLQATLTQLPQLQQEASFAVVCQGDAVLAAGAYGGRVARGVSWLAFYCGSNGLVSLGGLVVGSGTGSAFACSPGSRRFPPGPLTRKGLPGSMLFSSSASRMRFCISRMASYCFLACVFTLMR